MFLTDDVGHMALGARLMIESRTMIGSTMEQKDAALALARLYGSSASAIRVACEQFAQKCRE